MEKKATVQIHLWISELEKGKYDKLQEELGLTQNALYRGMLKGMYQLIENVGIENVLFRLKKIEIINNSGGKNER